MDFPCGTRFDDYEIVSPLGGGGMGQVYLATDLKLGRSVAVKFLREELAEDRDALKRFEQEARCVSALNHPNIVTIHAIGMLGSLPYIAMELVEGRTFETSFTKDLFRQNKCSSSRDRRSRGSPRRMPQESSIVI